MIIDQKDIYHIGASLKDLGKKWFAFSKINLDANEMIEKLGQGTTEPTNETKALALKEIATGSYLALANYYSET